MKAEKRALAAELAEVQRRLEESEQDRIRLQRSVDLISITATNYQQNLTAANRRLAEQEQVRARSQLLVQQLSQELEEARERSLGDGVAVGPAGEGGAVRISFVSAVAVAVTCEQSAADIEDGLPGNRWAIVFVPPVALGDDD